ncbi:MAG: hypothetical protein IKZ12_04835 [Alistipes sp.]|nr:hypothetical protein [Alistipes sp.]
MNIKVQIRVLLMLLAVAFAAACERAASEQEPTTGEATRQLVIRAAQPSMSRTALGEVEGGEQTIRWSVGDKLLLWAESMSYGGYAFSGAEFTLATYNAEYTSADFMASVGAMEQATYRYTAIYPLPASQQGSEVSYTLPMTQSGQYDPALDWMYAQTTGPALAESDRAHMEPEWDQPRLAFTHLCHLIRIRIPEGKNNLGLPIKRLEIEFPQPVVGTLSFDATDFENTAVWTPSSNTITVEVPDGYRFDAGEGYLWLHTMPTTLDGTVRFAAYNEAGVKSYDITTTIDRELEAQHITPIALTIPTSPLYPLTYVDLYEVANNLGEEWQTMTLSGYNFLVPFSENTVSEWRFTPDASKSYKVAICADPATMGGKSLPIRYESEHCLFDDPVVLPSGISASEYTRIEKRVPYLLEETFSTASASSSNDTYTNDDTNNTSTTGVALGGALSGWNASRYQVFANKFARIGVRYQCGAWVVGRYCGRLDTPPLTKLKAGANASVKVSFDMGCYIPNKAYVKTKVIGGVSTWDDSNNKVAYCLAGTHTDSSNPLAGKTQGDVADQLSNAVSFERMCDETNDTGAFADNNLPHKGLSFVTPGADKTTRVSWWALTDREDSAIGKNCHYYLYLDNIKIQIAN